MDDDPVFAGWGMLERLILIYSQGFLFEYECMRLPCWSGIWKGGNWSKHMCVRERKKSAVDMGTGRVEGGFLAIGKILFANFACNIAWDLSSI